MRTVKRSILSPFENHGFERTTRWADEYKRIQKRFEENLRTGKAPRPTH
ncbi:MAG TPA: hypothetical protein VNC21_02880 [Vicinamibacterales bacterium]|nr:hypothetical protein [Vicinamibacterales bacterium]